MTPNVTYSHRLILPGDTNHHGTLYAGSLLRIALEAAYVTAHRVVGDGANLLLRRVLNLECYRPVPVGTVVEIRGVALHLTRAYLVVGLIGVPLEEHGGPWMDGLMGFVQVDYDGQPAPFPTELASPAPDGEWHDLRDRLERLLRLR
ncbi:MAG: acyl-CoA hydrolase [Planctomycetia bacterium]|nr:acyl-CoA hydrolase [Planctomycetia bacterium]